MKITLTGYDFNRIMRTCTPALSKDDTRKALEHIEIRCKGGVGVATAGDGFVLAQCHFKYFGDDGVFLLRSHRSVKIDALITIETKGKKISVSDGSEVLTRKLCESECPNWGAAVSNSQKQAQRASIVISASRLRRILDSFSRNDDAVTFEIRGDVDGVVMCGRETYSLLLPIRVEGDRKLAEFARPEFEAVQEGERNA